MSNYWSSVRIGCKTVGLPEPVAEFKFHPTRKWRFDFAWPDWKLAVEIEGGVFTKGRHTRGVGAIRDMEKYNHAAADGWLVFRTTPQGLADLAFWRLVKQGFDS